MKFKTTNYKIQEIADEFKVYRLTSYFGIEWCAEYVGNDFYNLNDAKIFIKFLTSNEQIKLYETE